MFIEIGIDKKVMKDMFKTGNGHYVLGDCMDYLKDIPDNYFNLSICDPPYGIGAAKMNMGAGKSKKCSKIQNRKWEPKNWDSSTPSPEYFKELFRVSKNQIIWGGNYFDLPPCHGFVLWDKQIPKGLSFADCEMAWHSFKRVAKIFRYSAYRDKKTKVHPTQKPVALYRWLLQNYAKPNDLILDTHVGSASSLIACEMEGFKYVGFEKDSDYYQQSTKRIKQHLAQKVLF